MDDGTVFDSSIKGKHLKFTIGDGKVIRGFEQALVGMEPDESKIIKIPADESYGKYLKEMVKVVDRNQFPAHLKPEVGQRIEIPQANNTKITVTVTKVTDSKVTLDANHPLAGKDLIFNIKLIKIV